jgi:hypothetical protein
VITREGLLRREAGPGGPLGTDGELPVGGEEVTLSTTASHTQPGAGGERRLATLKPSLRST